MIPQPASPCLERIPPFLGPAATPAERALRISATLSLAQLPSLGLGCPEPAMDHTLTSDHLKKQNKRLSDIIKAIS